MDRMSAGGMSWRWRFAVALVCLASVSCVNAQPVPNPNDNPCYSTLINAVVDDSPSGIGIDVSIIVILLGMGAGITFYNYRKHEWMKISFEKVPLSLHDTFKRSFADYWRQSILVMDFIQIFTILTTVDYAFKFWGAGPEDNTGLNYRLVSKEYPRNAPHVARQILNMFLLDFDQIGWWEQHKYNPVFFAVVATCIALSFAYALFCASIYFEQEKPLLESAWGRKFVWSLTVIGPWLGNVMFIPITYNLLSVFSCIQQYRNTITGVLVTFPARDCTKTCWEGEHLMWSILSAFALLCYVPIALYTSPMWPLLHDSVTIQDQPKFNILNIHWKLTLVLCHAFFQQIPVAHAALMFSLTGLMLLMVVLWRPSTLPYFDLILITMHSLLFWTSIAVMCSLFFANWIIICMIVIGGGLIILEYFVLVFTDWGFEPAAFAPGSIACRQRQQKNEKLRMLREIERRKRLLKVASYNNARVRAGNAIDVPRLNEADRSGDLDVWAAAALDGKAGWVFRNKETGKEVTLLETRNAGGLAVHQAKVLGLELAAPINVRNPLTYKMRQDEAGTLVIMRSPQSTLYAYLKLKINGYVAYYNAHNKETGKQRPVEKAKPPKYRVYRTAIKGPSTNIMPVVPPDEDPVIPPYLPVNNNYLLAILQNAGPTSLSFLHHHALHSDALRKYIERTAASAHDLGKQMCDLFKVEGYRPVVEVPVPAPRTRIYLEKIKHIEKAMKNMEMMLQQRLKDVTAREYQRGRREAELSLRK